MRLICCQPDIVWEDRAANLARAAALLEAAAPPPGSLVLLPEMFASGFTMNLDDAGSREGTIAADLDRPALQAYRRDFPALRDARTDGV